MLQHLLRNLRLIGFVSLSVVLIAFSAAAEAQDHVVVEEVAYVDFHDPGRLSLETASGEKISAWFFYKLISFDEVDAWSKGEKFDVVVDDQTHGLGLIRQRTGKFYKVVFEYESHPFSVLEELCVQDGGGTQLAVNACAAETVSRWRAEQGAIINRLKEGLGVELGSELDGTQSAWEAYAEQRDSLYSGFSREHFQGSRYGYYQALMAASSEYGRFRDLIALFGTYPGDP